MPKKFDSEAVRRQLLSGLEGGDWKDCLHCYVNTRYKKSSDCKFWIITQVCSICQDVRVVKEKVGEPKRRM